MVGCYMAGMPLVCIGNLKSGGKQQIQDRRQDGFPLTLRTRHRNNLSWAIKMGEVGACINN